MKVPASVRTLYRELEPRYESLRNEVDRLIQDRKEPCWHYESRIKTEESFALKLETGRSEKPDTPEDLLACVLVVENRSKIVAAEQIITNIFDLRERRPRDPHRSPIPPDSFSFDDLRLYVAWRDEPSQRPSGLQGMLFEVQIRTFLQHAWDVATHDLVYKTDEVAWPTSRVAYQVKAMLENAELCINEAVRLTQAEMLNREDLETEQLRQTIVAVKERWLPEQLPRDLRRLAQNIKDLSRLLQISLSDLWAAVDSATALGGGAKTLDLSPYGAILTSLLPRYHDNLCRSLGRSDQKRKLFVPSEIEITNLPEAAARRLIRP